MEPMWRRTVVGERSKRRWPDPWVMGIVPGAVNERRRPAAVKGKSVAAVR